MVGIARTFAAYCLPGQSGLLSPAGRSSPHSIIGRSGRLSYLFGRLCGRLLGIDYIRHILVAMPVEAMPRMPRGYDARIVSAEELARHRIDADARVQADRFAMGMTCIGAFDRHGRLLGVTWLGTGHHRETVLRIGFGLPPGAAWDGGLWIDEERRMTRAFQALWAGVRDWLEAQGLAQTFSSIADYNAASIAAHRRLGATVVGQVGVIRIGGLQCTIGGRRRLCWSRTVWPKIDLPG
ncbi:hypothetical protein LWE61_02825 [Sphingobium sufflavum]|uniref:hypothetical protein n=1 Tax=Sphingobium sufflavum TaxID=1129547 RepID=UPI001F1D6833|nr:hypothetical protein [Sphingobium sufflavum]MCE7795487.1 hypothetical protein [Sphingobium sufflavum]